MRRYQVTALFGNIFRIVGADSVDYAEATRLLNLMQKAGRKVRVYEIVGAGSRLVWEG